MKLIMGFGIICAIVLTLAIAGYQGALHSEEGMDEVGRVRLPSLVTLLIMSEAQTAVDAAENALLSTRLSSQQRSDQYQRFTAAKKRADDAWKIYEPLPQTAEEARTWKLFVPAWARWWQDHEDYVRAVREFEALGIANLEAHRSGALYDKMVQQALVTNSISFSAAEALLNKLVAINDQVAGDAVKDTLQDAALAKHWALGMGLFGVIVSVLIGVYLTRSVLGKVTHATAHIGSALREISSGSAQLAERTQEQSAALEETASAMEQLTATVKQSATHASQANQLASDARQHAERGGKVVGAAITAMSEINQSSREISDIISVVDEIAFQTNLLALNAAVEAARAGEQGRGFAVVASEVRKLAQRSADAARAIKTLIRDSVDRVDEGERLVQRSGKTLTEIVAATKKVSDIVAEIAAATREQASGIEQVNLSITQMDQATQHNAALVEETANAVQTTSDQVTQLHRDLVGSTKEAPIRAPLPARAANKQPLALPSTRKAKGSTPLIQRAARVKDNGKDWEDF